MAVYNLVGRRRCSAVSRKSTCKCFSASILELIYDFFVKVLTERNVNISNELHFSDVYGSVNYIGSLANFTQTSLRFIHIVRDPMQFTLINLRRMKFFP